MLPLRYSPNITLEIDQQENTQMKYCKMTVTSFHYILNLIYIFFKIINNQLNDLCIPNPLLLINNFNLVLSFYYTAYYSLSFRMVIIDTSMTYRTSGL